MESSAIPKMILWDLETAVPNRDQSMQQNVPVFLNLLLHPLKEDINPPMMSTYQEQTPQQQQH